MSPRTQRIAIAAPVAGPFAIAALLGATILAVSLTPAHAQSAATTPTQQMQQTQTRGETVEQRITTLHAQLKITPAEDAKWNSVAQAMRDNAAAMEKLVADKTAKGQQNMTAVDDMKTYAEFAQAHVDGLKNLTSSFETLYDAMPGPQKKLADQVFENFGHRGAAARG
jgi:periplasmic protein CpxP/Spy